MYFLNIKVNHDKIKLEGSSKKDILRAISNIIKLKKIDKNNIILLNSDIFIIKDNENMEIKDYINSLI